MKKHALKFPKTRTCTIQEMLNYASTMNGLSRRENVKKTVQFALENITHLNKVKDRKWRDAKKLVRALESIDKIGITDSLELVNPKQSSTRFSNGLINELKEVAESLGLFVYRVDKLVCITRTPLTIKPAESKSLAEMQVSERGASSPELPLV